MHGAGVLPTYSCIAFSPFSNDLMSCQRRAWSQCKVVHKDETIHDRHTHQGGSDGQEREQATLSQLCRRSGSYESRTRPKKSACGMFSCANSSPQWGFRSYAATFLSIAHLTEANLDNSRTGKREPPRSLQSHLDERQHTRA